MFPVSRTIDRFDATFDHDNLVANAGLIIVATLMTRLGLEQLANRWYTPDRSHPAARSARWSRR